MSVTLSSFILVHFKSLKSCQITVADNNVNPPLHTMQVIYCNSNDQCLAATLCHLAQTPHKVLLHQNNPICTYVICSIIMIMIGCRVIALVFTGNSWRNRFIVIICSTCKAQFRISHNIHQTWKLFPPISGVSRKMSPIDSAVSNYCQSTSFTSCTIGRYFLQPLLFYCNKRKMLWWCAMCHDNLLER